MQETAPTPEKSRQLRTTFFALSCLGVLALVYAGEFLRRGNTLDGIVILFSAALVGFAIYDLRKTNNVIRPAHLAMVAMWIGLTFAAADMGGFSGPVRNWYLVIPLFAGTLAGLRAAIWWSMPATLGLLGFWWADHTGHNFTYSIPPNSRENFELFQILGILFTVSFLTMLLLREYRRTELSLLEAQNSLEHRVQERTSELVHSGRLAAVGQLAAGVAHELNQPLSGILVSAETGLRSSDDEGELARYEVIRSEAERMAAIVEQLLHISRPHARSPENVSLSSIISRARILLDNQLLTADIQLQLNLPEKLPQVIVNSPEIEQILLNLISNSIDAIKEAGDASSRNISVVGEFDPSAVRLIVSDSGIPIAPELETKLFDPFFTTKQRTKGTGLGLSISHGLMQSIGGDLRFQRDGTGQKQFVLEFNRT